MRRLVVVTVAVASLVGLARADGLRGIKDGELRLDVVTPGAFEKMPEAAPPRFLLMENGRFFVGGSDSIAEGQLESNEHKSLRKQLKSILKRKDLPANIELGPGETQYRLTFRRGETLTAVGDPHQAPYGVAREISLLLLTLLEFDHVSLKPLEPDRLLLMVRQGELRGGCRSWSLPIPLIDALPAPRVIETRDAVGWPRGAYPAAVCAEGRHYVVGLRPLLPVERP